MGELQQQTAAGQSECLHSELSYKSMEQGPTFRVTVPKYPTKDANYRILARQRSRFTHYYFYIRDETLGPMVMRVASFLPFQTTYYLNGHSFIEQELNREGLSLGPLAKPSPMLGSLSAMTPEALGGRWLAGKL